MMRRTYTAEDKAEAIGLALSIGPVRAARQLGLPHRTLTNWMHSPDAVVLRQETRDQVAAKLWGAVVVGVDEVLKGLRDPKARLSDKAQALRVVAEQYALLTGGVTERTENLNVETTVEIAERLSSPEIRAELLDWMERIENATDEEIAEYEQKTTLALNVAQRVLMLAPDDAGSKVALRDSLDAFGDSEEDEA